MYPPGTWASTGNRASRFIPLSLHWMSHVLCGSTAGVGQTFISDRKTEMRMLMTFLWLNNCWLTHIFWPWGNNNNNGSSLRRIAGLQSQWAQPPLLHMIVKIESKNARLHSYTSLDLFDLVKYWDFLFTEEWVYEERTQSEQQVTLSSHCMWWKQQ